MSCCPQGTRRRKEWPADRRHVSYRTWSQHISVVQQWGSSVGPLEWDVPLFCVIWLCSSIWHIKHCKVYISLTWSYKWSKVSFVFSLHLLRASLGVDADFHLYFKCNTARVTFLSAYVKKGQDRHADRQMAEIGLQLWLEIIFALLALYIWSSTCSTLCTTPCCRPAFGLQLCIMGTSKQKAATSRCQRTARFSWRPCCLHKGRLIRQRRSW